MKHISLPLLGIIALLMLCLTTTGCLQTRVETPEGFTFETSRLFYFTDLGHAEAQLGTNRIVIESYQGRGDSAAIEAVARGVAQGMQPPPEPLPLVR